MRSEWQTIHPTLSLIIRILLLLPQATYKPCRCTTCKTLFHKHSTHTIKKACPKPYLMLGANMDHCGRSQKYYRSAIHLTTDLCYDRYLMISIDNTISSQLSGPILQPFTQKLWQRYISMTYGNSSSNQEVRHSPCIFWISATTTTLRLHTTTKQKNKPSPDRQGKDI